jgi:diguanylate cyclase (GGDEF)-like protein/PAS domain S-box-containing protein
VSIARQSRFWWLLGISAVVLLAGVILPGVMGNLSGKEALRARLATLQMEESRFRELVIRLRHGVTSNYDEANLWMNRIRANQAVLARDSGGNAEFDALLKGYQQAVQDQDTQWNDFKLRNALVRNSLRYFQSDALDFMRVLPNDYTGEALRQTLMSLNNALMLQALGEGKEAREAAQTSLEILRPLAVELPQPLRLEFGRLSQHAEIISRHSPFLEADVQGLIHGQAREALTRLADLNHAHLIAEQKLATSYRVGLLAGVILLLLAFALVLIRYFDSLHQRAKDLALAGTVFQSSQQGIIVTNSRGDIVRVNPAYCRITGYSEAELLGKNPRMLKSGLQDAAFYQTMWASLKAKGRWQGEIKNRRKNGEYYVQWVNIDAISGEQGEDLFVGIASDISELVDSREQLSNLAYFDTLTGLPNRALFQDRLRQAMIQTRREHAVMALVFVDLDNFKAVNDTLGHAIGDELLVEVARRLHERVRESDTVARLGGDEFAIILMDAKGAEEMVRIATHLVEALSVPYKLSGYDVAGGASLGITFYPIDAMTPEELLKNADVAMYRAKERGRNNFQFFTGDMAAGLAENMRIENGLRRAMEAGELSLFYQPQFTPDGRMLGVEALMRWHSAELGHVPPGRFISVAEKSGIITELGEFALHEACNASVRSGANASVPDFHVAVNLSAAQFKHEGLAERVAAVLHEFSLPGAALELEITESVVMEDVARGQEVLRGLKALGCRIAIDDFGTGYSSLAYLKRFQVDVLKIDKSFVDGLGVEAEDTAVAQAIISLARSLRLDVVAEGVETTLQLDCLSPDWQVKKVLSRRVTCFRSRCRRGIRSEIPQGLSLRDWSAYRLCASSM